MQPTNIISLFVEDHARISSLLNDFKKNKYKKSKKTAGLFNQLSNALRNHFKEEELLYSKYKYKTGNIIPVIQTIKREHEIFSGKLDMMQLSIKKQDKINTTGFFELLLRHKNIEERLLYPELDNVLSDKEKEDIYWKLKIQAL